MRWLSLVALIACSGSDDKGTTTDDARTDVEKMCDGDLGDVELLIGEGVAGAFAELQDGAQVSVDIAPQGGFGVTVVARTTGLMGDDVAEVTVRTEINGLTDAEFTFVDNNDNPTQQLFCQDDGRSALGAGVAIGFDKDKWQIPTDLDGVTADLILEITDSRGVTAVGRKTVTIIAGG